VKFRQNFKARAKAEPAKFSLQALQTNAIPNADLKPLYEYDKSLLETPVDITDYVLKDIDPQVPPTLCC